MQFMNLRHRFAMRYFLDFLNYLIHFSEEERIQVLISYADYANTGTGEGKMR